MSTPTTTTTRLLQHDVVLWQGHRYRVTMVNESRARLLSIDTRTRTFMPATGRDAGKLRTFQEPLPPLDLSPNSELAIVGRWDPETQQVKEVA